VPKSISIVEARIIDRNIETGRYKVEFCIDNNQVEKWTNVDDITNTSVTGGKTAEMLKRCVCAERKEVET